jgi:glycerate-2-kinase
LRSAIDRNDSAAVFRSLGQELITGPTRTNVNDLRAILVMPSC